MPPNTQTVTRQQFVQAVRDFKKLHKGKLKDLLNKQKNPDVIREFWSNPIMNQYLSRDASGILFDSDNCPILKDSKTKNEHDITDHYELKVYKHLSEEVIYRTSKMMDSKQNIQNFYARGVSDKDIELLFKALTPLSNDFAKVTNPSCSRDLVRDMTKLQFITNNAESGSPRFIPFFHSDLNHVTAALSIMDPIKNRILVTVCINSAVIDPSKYECGYNRFKHLQECFSTLEFYNSPGTMLRERAIERFKMKQQINRLFSIDIDNYTVLEKNNLETAQGKSVKLVSSTYGSINPFNFLRPKKRNVLINISEKAACIVDLERTVNEMDGFIPEGYEQIFKLSNLENIYVIEKQKGLNEVGVKVFCKPQGRLIDASHHLQTAPDDKNCGLYTFNFVNAMIDFLKQPNNAEKVYQLALAFNQNKSSAKGELIHIFREALKAYLPFYYDQETGISKPPEELKKIHLQQRWNLGRKSIQILHPLKDDDSTPHQSTP